MKKQTSWHSSLCLAILTCLNLAAVAQSISYFNQGFLRQGSAALDRAYLGINGTNAGGTEVAVNWPILATTNGVNPILITLSFDQSFTNGLATVAYVDASGTIISNALFSFALQQTNNFATIAFAESLTNNFDTIVDVNSKTNSVGQSITDATNGLNTAFLAKLVSATNNALALATNNDTLTAQNATNQATVVSNGIMAKTITFTDGAGIGMSGSPVSLGGTVTLSATTATPQFTGLALGRAAVAGQMIVEFDALAAIVTNALTLTNTTAATASVRQNSPGLLLMGNGWNTQSLTNVPGGFIVYDLAAGTGDNSAPSGAHTLHFDFEKGNNTRSSAMTLTGGGAMLVPSSVTTASYQLSSAGQGVQFNVGPFITGTAALDMILKTSSSVNGFNRLQFGGNTNAWPAIFVEASTNNPALSIRTAGTNNGYYASLTVSNLLAQGAVGGTNGVYSQKSNLAAPTSITVGASPFSWTNTSSQQNVYAFVAGGTISAIAINGTTVWTVAGNTTVPLEPGEYVSVTYSVSPTMFWKPF